MEMMIEEQIDETGHLQFIKNSLEDLNEFHYNFLESGDTKYYNYYKAALPSIQEFKNRSKSEKTNEIEICLNGLYSLFLLRLQKKEISAETLKSFSTFSEMLAYLATQYKKYETGELEL